MSKQWMEANMPIEKRPGLIGWWTNQAMLQGMRAEDRNEIQAACKYSRQSDCPYRREDFDCADCVIEEDGVHLRL